LGKRNITLQPLLVACIKLVTKPISTGSKCADEALEGGIAQETITLVYGEPETGKSTLAMQCAANCAIQNRLKTLYVDCDDTFTTERLADITQLRFNEVSEQIILIKPRNFAEQTAVVDNLQNYVGPKFGLVVIDTFNGLYRAQVAENAYKPKNQFNLSRELNRQMAVLAQTAKTQHIPIITTSQVKANINEPYVTVAPVATRVVEFWANNIIQLKPTENPQTIQADITRKDQNPQKPQTCYLRITQTGIHDNE
jgi:RecA/RadA recombinase